MTRHRPRNLTDDTGATATEYAILITLIAAAILAIVFGVGGQIAAFFQEAAESF